MIRFGKLISQMTLPEIRAALERVAKLPIERVNANQVQQLRERGRDLLRAEKERANNG